MGRIHLALALCFLAVTAMFASPAPAPQTDGKSISAADKAKAKPHERCKGAKMYYTPLIMTEGDRRWELGVCDSSCLSILNCTTTSVRSVANHSDAKTPRRKKRRLRTEDQGVEAHNWLWYCDETVTLPEDDLDPDEYKDKFPFNARTCFTQRGADHGRTAQVEFEKACIKAQGTFTNPEYKTWLPGAPKAPDRFT